jgi:hypothetical protein
VVSLVKLHTLSLTGYLGKLLIWISASWTLPSLERLTLNVWDNNARVSLYNPLFHSCGASIKHLDIRSFPRELAGISLDDCPNVQHLVMSPISTFPTLRSPHSLTHITLPDLGLLSGPGWQENTVVLSEMILRAFGELKCVRFPRLTSAQFKLAFLSVEEGDMMIGKFKAAGVSLLFGTE